MAGNGAVGGVGVKITKVAGKALADRLLRSNLFGPGGPLFGNTFYAGAQGYFNYGHVRVGWSFNASTQLLEFAIRIGKEHLKLFVRPPL
jgi:hypothetical protein